ncbi:MAG: hypothetical protein WA437_02175 [Candidatus Sulfotelmatobacter sp.]
MDAHIEQTDSNHPVQKHADPDHADSNHADSNHAEPKHETSHHEQAQGRNVAVIAIHGVGEHEPGASAAAVATLLLSIDKSDTEEGVDRAGNEDRRADQARHAGQPENSRPYCGFAIDSVDVPLHPVLSPAVDAEDANERYQQSWFERLWGIFDERRGFLSKTRKGKGGHLHARHTGYEERELRPGEPDRGEYAYRFMITQLAGYEGVVSRDFQTDRLEGKRKSDSSAPTVHIYDAHYSDLSKPQSNILAFFFAFYQLLFHLASLSLLAVYWAEAENVTIDSKRRWRWRIVSSLHASSVRLLTIFVPILNVVLLEIACSAFIDKAKGKAWLLPGALASAGLLGLVATFILLRKHGSPSRPMLWALVPFLGAGLGILTLGGLACLYNCYLHPKVSLPETLLLIIWLTVTGTLLGWIGWKFEQLRPGAYALSILLFVINAGWFLFYLLPNAQSQFAVASLWAVQWIFGELLLSWILCLLCALFARPLAIFCTSTIRPRRQGDEEAEKTKERTKERKARAIAAFRTGRFAFSIPAVLFVIVTCVLWSGIVAYGSYKLKTFDAVTLKTARSGLSNGTIPGKLIPDICAVTLWMERIGKSYEAAEETAKPYETPECREPEQQSDRNDLWTNYLRGLLLVSITPALPLTMVIFAACLLLLIWMALPSVVFEIKPKWTRNATTDKIRSLGKWLSRGIDNTAILTRLLWAAIVPLPLLFFVVDWLILRRIVHQRGGWEDYVNKASYFTLPLIEKTGLVLAVSASAVFGFILKYLTTILDAILDVDNYLRTSPQRRTPRAKIAERMTSLLSYIAQQTDEQGQPLYSKVIIVAHSLGSMVTTDLLRYLERSGKGAPDPGLARYGFRKPAKEARDLPIYVFSMGSPLRQLLNRFFPHLYWWVSDIPDNSLADVGDPVGPPMPGIESPLPRTDEMNVTHWSNAYRSGDYIGRSLWIGQWMQRNSSGDPTQPAEVASEVAPWPRDEMCIGLGAHTHYWDRSAPEIAKRLDDLIIL